MYLKKVKNDELEAPTEIVVNMSNFVYISSAENAPVFSNL